MTEETENDFSILKKHETPMHSSVTGNMTALLQLCQNNLNQEHFYTYEVLDSNGAIIGSRLFYHFKEPHQAVEQWDSFVNTMELDSNIEVTIIKQHFPSAKKFK